ncbi:hypothetical protein JARJAR_179 [Bacillus phage vB_BanH_JarJar]|nr:hypothetical protein BEYONPHE_193 [Bacillus phage Beyonphe]UGO48993.1 hypothetical protein JARJAR_179 [Bacillus phage vB_BanH_JarJar]UGO50483.1 hypothetical protein RONSWANSON_177 [Bacillus phage vB_BanH_RonSwanson]
MEGFYITKAPLFSGVFLFALNGILLTNRKQKVSVQDTKYSVK